MVSQQRIHHYHMDALGWIKDSLTKSLLQGQSILSLKSSKLLAYAMAGFVSSLTCRHSGMEQAD
jgi:hypothetical protein